MNRQRPDEPRVLILETSGPVGRVALAQGRQLGAERTLDETRRHARDLAPVAAELCAARGWKLRDLDVVIVSLGPGSYTGLRVGIMSAKGLAYAAPCVLLGIPTFAGIARQAPAEAATIDVIADAQQSSIYVQRWQQGAAGWQAQALRICPAAEWLAAIEPGVWVSGPGVRLHRGRLTSANPIVPDAARAAQPETLLTLGLERYRAGEADDVWALEPLYLRPSNAEENWDRRQRNEKLKR